MKPYIFIIFFLFFNFKYTIAEIKFDHYTLLGIDTQYVILESIVARGYRDGVGVGIYYGIEYPEDARITGKISYSRHRGIKEGLLDFYSLKLDMDAFIYKYYFTKPFLNLGLFLNYLESKNVSEPSEELHYTPLFVFIGVGSDMEITRKFTVRLNFSTEFMEFSESPNFIDKPQWFVPIFRFNIGIFYKFIPIE